MKALEFFIKPVDGKIVIDVPGDLDGIELKVLVLEKEAPLTQKFRDMPPEERLEYLKQFQGTAKYPNFPTNKCDVYDQ